MLGPQAPRVVRNLWSYARWAIQAKPGDHLIALSAASASLPVVGRHLELVSGFAALGVGGRHYLPGLIDGVRQTRSTPDRRELRRAQQALTPGILSDALDGIVAAELLGRPWPAHRQQPPVLKALAQRRYVHRSSVRYGAHPGQLLDVWRTRSTSRAPAPVLIFVPGGAWVFGRRELQGHALMAHLVRRGWVCLSVQYRAGPRHRWPHQMIDVKTAIAWARANAHQFGGDREFIAIAGCSAGGHLATLAGLTAGDPQWQSELAGNANTAVDAVVSLYGQYDWNDRSSDERERFMGFLERAVVRRSQARHPELFRAASPIERVQPDAPPFLVVHGSDDGLIPATEARQFVERLRSLSASIVAYVELPGAGHGFDLTDGVRTAAVNAGIGRFLQQVHEDRVSSVLNSVV